MLSHKLRYRADKEYAFKNRARSYRRSLLLGIIKRPSPQMIQRYGITDEEVEMGRAACEIRFTEKVDKTHCTGGVCTFELSSGSSCQIWTLKPQE